MSQNGQAYFRNSAANIARVLESTTPLQNMINESCKIILFAFLDAKTPHLPHFGP